MTISAVPGVDIVPEEAAALPSPKLLGYTVFMITET